MKIAHPFCSEQELIEIENDLNTKSKELKKELQIVDKNIKFLKATHIYNYIKNNYEENEVYSITMSFYDDNYINMRVLSNIGIIKESHIHNSHYKIVEDDNLHDLIHPFSYDFTEIKEVKSYLNINDNYYIVFKNDHNGREFFLKEIMANLYNEWKMEEMDSTLENKLEIKKMKL